MPGKIMIVEDDPATQQLLEFLLQKEGYQIVKVAEGDQVLENARREKPDLILMDIMLPRMNGIEATKQIRREAPLKKIPVLILSALGQEMEVTVGLSAGADGYLVKPFKPHELLQEVKKRLKA